MSKKLSTLALFALSTLACDSAETFEGVSPDTLAAPAGKADGTQVNVRAAGRYDLLTVRGDAASALFDVYDRAGGLSTLRRNGLEYRYGVYTICVSNGEAAACNLYSRAATLEEAGFLATIHGERFDSASSEVFGALARAQGDSPATLTEVESDGVVCAKSSVDVWCGFTDAQSEAPTLELAFADLPALGDDYLYEGWLITADGPVTSGRFVVDADDDGDHTFTIDQALANASVMFVLTIEPKFGDDPAPSDTHILAGAFEGGQAALTMQHAAALGTDFLNAEGGFILETPTSAAIAADMLPTVSARATDAPPCRMPIGWCVRASTGMLAVTDSSSMASTRISSVSASVLRINAFISSTLRACFHKLMIYSSTANLYRWPGHD